MQKHAPLPDVTRRRLFGAMTILILLLSVGVLLIGKATTRENKGTLAREIDGYRAFSTPRPDEFFSGTTTARVVVLEYFDFECPYCRAYHKNGEPYLLNKYKDADVAFARRYLPLTYLHPYALVKAQLLVCAAKRNPEAYGDLVTTLYETPFEGTSTLAAVLAQISATDAAAIAQCVEEGDSFGEIANDVAKAGTSNVGITPTFVIYKDGVERARIEDNRLQRLDSTIELLLAEK